MRFCYYLYILLLFVFFIVVTVSNNKFWTREWPTHFFLGRLGHGPGSPYSEWTTMSDSSPTIDVTPAPSDDVASQPQDDVTPQPAEIVMTPPADNREEISRLKHQKGGFLSHLSRLYKEADQLMFDRGTVADVTSFVEKIRTQFAKLEQSHITLTQLLGDSERDSVEQTFAAISVCGFNDRGASERQFSDISSQKKNTCIRYNIDLPIISRNITNRKNFTNFS